MEEGEFRVKQNYPLLFKNVATTICNIASITQDIHIDYHTVEMKN